MESFNIKSFFDTGQTVEKKEDKEQVEETKSEQIHSVITPTITPKVSKITSTTSTTTTSTTTPRRRDQHNRTQSAATTAIKESTNLYLPVSEQAIPLINALWMTLNSEDSAAISIDEMLILGEAMIGHPPTVEAACLQIHRCRSSLACKEINDLFVDQFAGSLRYSKSRKKISREEESLVRDFVTSKLRHVLRSWLGLMFPSDELELYRTALATKIETFYINLPNNNAGGNNKALSKALRKYSRTLTLIN